MNSRKIAILLLLIVVVQGMYLYNSSQKVRFDYESCNQKRSQYCIYGGADVFSDMNALMWVSENLPAGTTFLNWRDYSRELELIGNADPVAKDLPETLLETDSGFEDSGNLEDKVKDAAVFLSTNNFKSALCIAQKHGAEYAYLTAADFTKYPSIHDAADNGDLITPEQSRMISQMYSKGSITFQEKTRMEDRQIIERLNRSVYARLYMTQDYNNMYFEEVYSDRIKARPFSSRVKIFSINTSAMPKYCCYNSTCKIEGRRIALNTISQMSLNLGDMPQNYSIPQADTYLIENIPVSELEYGWRAGQRIQLKSDDGQKNIGNRIDVYDRDNIKARFGLLNGGLKNTSGLVPFSVPNIGDEAVAHNITYPDAKVLYRIDFRKYDVMATVSILGPKGLVSAGEAIMYAKIVEGRIG